MTEFPAPLTPPDCDLRDFQFMPLDVVRLRQSDLVTQEEPEAIVAALMLWGAAWHNVPAASLSDNDKTLAQHAGYGRAVSAWLEVKEAALRGFVKCSDGRLYHAVVAEKARESWESRLKYQWSREMGRRRKHNERYKKEPEKQIETVTFEAWNVTRDTPETSQRQQPENKPAPQVNNTPKIESVDKKDEDKSKSSMSRATIEKVTRDNGEGHKDFACDIALKGQGEGQGQGQGDSIGDNETLSPSLDLHSQASLLAEIAGLNLTVPAKLTTAIDILMEWKKEGIDFETTILETVKTQARENPTQSIFSLRYFDPAIRKRHGLEKHAPKFVPRPEKPIEAIDVPDSDDDRVGKFRAALERAVGARTYARHFGSMVAVKVEDDRLISIVCRKEVANILNLSHSQSIVRASREVGLVGVVTALK